MAVQVGKNSVTFLGVRVILYVPHNHARKYIPLLEIVFTLRKYLKLLTAEICHSL